MTKILNSSVPYLQSPCERCGSKKIVAKIWTEKTATSFGQSTIQHTQIICSNPECQSKFDKSLANEESKRKKAKKVKEDAAIERKEVAAQEKKRLAAKA
jgi:hypothetical protein